MPELPEVETVRRSLVPRLTGRVVIGATLHRRDIAVMPGDPEGGFSRQRSGVRTTARRVRAPAVLVRAHLVEPRRHGKQLALVAEDGRAIVVHLGMTGQLRWAAKGARIDPADHIHATWRLDDGSRLVFRDPRRFGGLWLLPEAGMLEARWAELGPDGLRTPPAELAAGLRARLLGTRRAIKAALLDQRVVAGVGNIYADEALHEAGVHPQRLADGLAGAEVDRLAGAVSGVLTRAVEARGSTLRDYADAEGRRGEAQLVHRVYGRSGQACLACGAALETAQVAQRTTVWCPACQPAG